MSATTKRNRLTLILPISAVLLTGLFSVFLNGQPSTEVKTDTEVTKTDNKTDLYISLSSSQDSYYLRENITIAGTIVNSSGKNTNQNTTVLLEAFNGEAQVYKSYAVTQLGQFESSFKLQNPGDIKITAKLSVNSSVPDAIITVPLQSQIDTIAIVVTIILIIVPTGGFLLIPYKRRILAMLLGIASLVSGLVFLHLFASLGEALTTALSTVLFVPIGTFIFDYINKRSQEESNREATVGAYRNDNLKNEVDTLIKIYEEITEHQSIFQRTINDVTARLSTKNYQTQNIVGTIASLPGLRINMYYRFIGLFNACLDCKAGRRGSIRNIYRFNNLFDNFKRAYAELETVLYVNIIYSIAEIHHKFLSFPTVRLPMRISRPLYWELLASNALKRKVNEEDIKFVTGVVNGQVQASNDQKKRTNLIELERRSHHRSKIEYYKNEDENVLQEEGLLDTNTALRDLWDNRAKEVYDLYRVMNKEDLYDDGIAYKFMTHLGKLFGEKYNELEKMAAKLPLLDLEAYSQVVHAFNNESIYIILEGNSTRNVDKLQFEIQSRPFHGTLSQLIDRKTVRYTPKSTFSGIDSFKFIITDGTVDSEPAEVSIQVTKR